VCTAQHELAWFIGVTFAWSWGWWIPMAAFSATVEQGDPWPSEFPALLGPLFGAVVATAVSGGRTALADYGRRLVR
jgi:uncharacterized protein